MWGLRERRGEGRRGGGSGEEKETGGKEEEEGEGGGGGGKERRGSHDGEFPGKLACQLTLMFNSACRRWIHLVSNLFLIVVTTLG